MRALVRRDNAVYVDRDAPDPAPAAGEAVVRPTLCAVGPADVAVARGDVPHQGVMGHRFVGVVEEIAGKPESVRPGVAVGARVVGDINIVDSKSELARRGLGRHAPDRAVLGLVKRDGCFADRVALPVSNLAAVPDEVPDDAAVFAEPLAAAVHAAQIVRLEGKQYVTVLGDNLSALLCSLVMASLNHSVRLLGDRDDRQRIAEKWGVKHRPVGEVGRRQDQDIVVECTGAASNVELALQLVRPRGKIILKAEPLPLPGVPSTQSRGVDLLPVVLSEIELVGARCGRVGDGVDFLARHARDMNDLITRRVKLDDATSALRAASDERALTVVIEV